MPLMRELISGKKIGTGKISRILLAQRRLKTSIELPDSSYGATDVEKEQLATVSDTNRSDSQDSKSHRRVNPLLVENTELTKMTGKQARLAAVRRNLGKV